MSIFLETDRLILKTPEESDLENLSQLRSDPEVMKYIGTGAVQTMDEVQKFLKNAILYQAKYGFGFCSVFEKESGDFVGQAGLFHLGFCEEQSEIEIAYRLKRTFWGRGNATEIVKALIQWGFTHLPNEKLVAIVNPENVRSKHVLEKAGMTYTGKVIYYGEEIRCYEIYKSDAIHLVPYDSNWANIAATEIKKILSELPPNHIIDIQHVGSTAIPNIMSKPIIDIQVAVDSLIAIKEIAITKLKKSGYEYWHENPDPERMFFVKGMPPFGRGRSHHVHIVEPASRHWQEKILFRNYLRENPEIAREYEKLKIELANEHTYDRERYTEAKTNFVNDVIKRSKLVSNNAKQPPQLIFVTGASGAGKTTLLNEFKRKHSDSKIACLHFDDIGVPDDTEMKKIYGSPSEWQKAMTYHWVKNILLEYKENKLVILEGQVNLNFIKDACKGFNFHQYQIILFHCESNLRNERLYHNRKQPELISDQMNSWSNFLKQQAIDMNVTILDTTLITVDDMVNWFENFIQLKKSS